MDAESIIELYDANNLSGDRPWDLVNKLVSDRYLVLNTKAPILHQSHWKDWELNKRALVSACGRFLEPGDFCYVNGARRFHSRPTHVGVDFSVTAGTPIYSPFGLRFLRRVEQRSYAQGCRPAIYMYFRITGDKEWFLTARFLHLDFRIDPRRANRWIGKTISNALYIGRVAGDEYLTCPYTSGPHFHYELSVNDRLVNVIELVHFQQRFPGRMVDVDKVFDALYNASPIPVNAIQHARDRRLS